MLTGARAVNAWFAERYSRLFEADGRTKVRSGMANKIEDEVNLLGGSQGRT